MRLTALSIFLSISISVAASLPNDGQDGKTSDKWEQRRNYLGHGFGGFQGPKYGGFDVAGGFFDSHQIPSSRDKKQHDTELSVHKDVTNTEQQSVNNGGDERAGHQEQAKIVTVTKNVPVPVPVAYPVEVVEHIPYHVPKPVPYEVKKPYPVVEHKPYPVTVEKPYPVPVEKRVPYPVYVFHKVLVPYPYEVYVHKPVPYHVPYPVKVPVPHPVIVYKKVPVYVEPKGFDEKKKEEGQGDKEVMADEDKCEDESESVEEQVEEGERQEHEHDE